MGKKLQIDLIIIIIYFYPIASFSGKTLTQVLCSVRLNITLLLGLGSTRYNFV